MRFRSPKADRRLAGAGRTLEKHLCPSLLFFFNAPPPPLLSNPYGRRWETPTLQPRPIVRAALDDAGGSFMFDLVLVLAGIGYFGVMLIYAGLCDRL